VEKKAVKTNLRLENAPATLYQWKERNTMPLHLFEDNDFLTNTLNVIPFPILVVDDEIRILFWNSAALRLLGSEEVYQQRDGEMLHCIHSGDMEEGCGYGPHCKTCVIRNSVNEASRGGKVYRKKTVLKRQIGDHVTDLPLLVTTSPYSYNDRSLTLLILEDIHELMEVGGLLPICANCKKIRSGNNEWQQIEGYIQKHIVDVDFTHGLCPECSRIFFPEAAKSS
jgi:PAS domain-containing protein